MNMIKNTVKRVFSLVVLGLVALMCFGLSTTKAKALTATDTVSYPFRTGQTAFANAPTIKNTADADTKGDHWMFYQFFFASTALSGMDYFAIQVKFTGNPGITWGAVNNGIRLDSADNTDGHTYYTVSTEGVVTVCTMQYGAIWCGTNFEGMLLIPQNQLTFRWGNAFTSINNYYFTTNETSNFGWSMTVGEVGYYTGDPANGGTFHKLLDLTQGEKKTSYYADKAGSLTEMTFPSDLGDVNIGSNLTAYPFEKKYNQVSEDPIQSTFWVGPTANASSANWTTLLIDLPNVDLSAASAVVIQFNAVAGCPGLTFGLQRSWCRANTGIDGKTTYKVQQGATLIEKNCDVLYSAVNTSGNVALIIPMEAFAYQFGSTYNTKDSIVSSVDALIMTTNQQYNWNYQIVVGEIGYFTGALNSSPVYHKILGNKQVFAASHALIDSTELGTTSVKAYKEDKQIYGDTTIALFGTNKVAANFSIWEGGSMGTVEMTTDTYGDEAMKLTCTGANPTGDAYTAITLADGIHYNWADGKGITCWARNDSDKEISFNFEIDVKNPDVKNSNKQVQNCRFNVQGGYRFWLYDVKTGKQTIYQTRPCVTLPVGFEGWVRIPFEAFAQAAWSASSQAVFPTAKFLGGSESAQTYVSYLCITIYSGDYTNCSFSVNKVGVYTQTPSFVSALVPESATRKSIATLMGLSE